MDAKWYANKSNVIQVYGSNTMLPEAVVPSVAVEGWPRSFFDKWLKPIASPKPNKFAILKRCHAMGDVLMLAPILNANPSWTLLTDPQFVPYMGDMCITQWPKGRRVYDLEYVLEIDHTRSELFQKPRFELYCDALEIPLPEPMDWRLPLDPPRAHKEPYIFFQYQGSMPWKRLPRNIWHTVEDGLKRILPVVNECPESGPNNGNCRALSQVEFAGLVAHADLVICHDSGVLWMAHCFGIPTLVLAGPTHPDKLTKHHPSICNALWKGLPCSPCGEAKVSGCNLECLQFNPQEIINAASDLLQQRWATYPRTAVA